jgi:hypothetical protein
MTFVVFVPFVIQTIEILANLGGAWRLGGDGKSAIRNPQSAIETFSSQLA